MVNIHLHEDMDIKVIWINQKVVGEVSKMGTNQSLVIKDESHSSGLGKKTQIIIREKVSFWKMEWKI